MNTTFPTNQQKLLTLQEASQKLGVNVETLLLWNEYNILKPTITPTGTVGYTEAQITQFLRIQQSFQALAQPTEQSNSLPLPSSVPSPTPLPLQNFDVILQNPTTEDTLITHKTSKHPFLLFPTLTIAFALVAIGVLAQQGQLQSLMSTYEKAYQVKSPTPGPQTSGLKLNDSLAIATEKNQANGSTLSRNDSDSMFAQKPTNAPAISKTLTPTPASNQHNKMLIATVAGVMKSLLDKPSSTTNTSVPTNDVLTFASVTSTKAGTSVPNSPFDTRGNLTGNTSKSQTLAMNLSGVDIAGSNQPFETLDNNLRNQLIVAAIGGLGLIVILLRKKPQLEVAAPVQNIVSSERLFELDQKMDGTVVLYYQGKAYKISKPELHSDSDQFIERLMTLYQPGSKEMEYDTAQDTLKLTAPLSRLVTRLGFVGVKRDLFFPRTAKHSVLFRKYITRQDLEIMNITVDHILKDMTVVA